MLSYLKQIAQTTAQGDAREESYYAHLSGFLSGFAKSIDKTKTQITTLPKKRKRVTLTFGYGMEGNISLVILKRKSPVRN